MNDRWTCKRPLTTALCTIVLLATLGCGDSQHKVNPSSFDKDWFHQESGHFNFHLPPNTGRGTRALDTFGKACNQRLDQVIEYFNLDVAKPLSVYLFNTNQDCEAATGHPAGFVDGDRIYTRIGAPMGGAIALAALNSIDPDTKSYMPIKDGIREIFNHSDVNVHIAAHRMSAEGRLFSLKDLVTSGFVSDDPQAYDASVASLVAYLLQRYGLESFKALWRSSLGFQEALETIYDGSLDTLEAEWIAHMEREAKRT